MEVRNEPRSCRHGQIVMGPTFWIATAIFLLAYALIIYDKIHKTIIAIFGAALLIVLGIITQEEAFNSLSWVLTGM